MEWRAVLDKDKHWQRSAARLSARLLTCAVRVWQELMTALIAGKWL